MISSDVFRRLGFLGVASTGEFNVRSYSYDTKSTVLAISKWQRVPECHRATAIQFVVSDEDGILEWTLTADRSVLPSVVQLVLPITPASHRLLVRMKILIKGVTSRGTATLRSAADTKCYENLHEVSCQVEHSSALTQLTHDHFKDFRPRLRENVGWGSGPYAEMTVLAPFDSVLPMTDSSVFRHDAREDSIQIVFYEGKDKAAYCSRRLFKLSFSLPSEISLRSLTRRRKITAKFLIMDDGSFYAKIGEEFGNPEECYSPQILDVIGRKLPTNTTEPTLTIAGGRDNQVELRINTTYSPKEIERWQITLAPHSRSVGTYSKSSIFLVPVTGFEQCFQVPMETVTDGTGYGIKVDGLQLCDSEATESVAFKVVCSNSTTATWNAPAKMSLLDQFRRQMQLAERTPQTPISSASTRARKARAIPVATRLIEIERTTFRKATVVISNDNTLHVNNAAWKITISNIPSVKVPYAYSLPREFSVQATGCTEQRYDIPLEFQPGHSYQVQVEGLGVQETSTFTAELTISDIRLLHAMAKRHTSGYGTSPCLVLYRNKSVEYFADILRNEGGIMRVYDKDNSGDPASPINLQIQGLFFMATVERGSNGEPMRSSAFGPVRICVDAEELLSKAPNLYFADYYCMRGQNHYVTLVMTWSGSTADRFCEPRLLKLDIDDGNDNPFFFRNKYGQLQVSRGNMLQIELLFTEDLDIRRYPRTITPIVGKGSSTKGGIPKNPLCQQCNLRGSTGFPKF